MMKYLSNLIKSYCDRSWLIGIFKTCFIIAILMAVIVIVSIIAQALGVEELNVCGCVTR